MVIVVLFASTQRAQKRCKVTPVEIESSKVELNHKLPTSPFTQRPSWTSRQEVKLHPSEHRRLPAAVWETKRQLQRAAWQAENKWTGLPWSLFTDKKEWGAKKTPFPHHYRIIKGPHGNQGHARGDPSLITGSSMPRYFFQMRQF